MEKLLAPWLSPYQGTCMSIAWYIFYYQLLIGQVKLLQQKKVVKFTIGDDVIGTLLYRLLIAFHSLRAFLQVILQRR